MHLHRIGLAVGLALIAAGVLVAAAPGTRIAAPERRADLNRVVVQHVVYLLSDRFSPAWLRIHPVDRQAIGRRLWESCKRSSDEPLTEVQYQGVNVVGSRSVRFRSRLHRRVTAVAVTVEVDALLAGVPFAVEGVSHWVNASGRWARLVEQGKLEAYLAGRCPA